jgi:hypothetical protein
LFGMTETHVLSALKRQYGRTLGSVARGEDRGGDVAHLAAVIRMFNPDEDLSAIRAIRSNIRHRRDRKGAWTTRALAVLREAAEPMTTREIARCVAQAHSGRTVHSIQCSLQVTLPKLHGVMLLPGSPKRWCVVGTAAVRAM